VHVVLTKHGEGYRTVHWTDAEAMPRVAAREENVRKPAGSSAALPHEQALLAAKDELVRLAERRNALELDAAKDRADRFAEDCLFSPRQQLERARGEWEQARASVSGVEDPSERIKARAGAERLEREYRRKLQQLRAAEDQRYNEKDRMLATLAQKAKVIANRTLVATAYFWVE
jgi:hypothetical protein